MSILLDHVLRVAACARNSNDAARAVRYTSPLMISADWTPAVECARTLVAEGLPAGASFFADDAFAVYFLAGYALVCGRPECFEPLSKLAAMMWANIHAAAQSEAA